MNGGRHLHEAIAFLRAVISLAASPFPLGSALLARTSRSAVVTTAPPYPRRHFLTRHIPPYAPRTPLHDILCLLYGLYAHECHVKTTAQIQVQSIQSQPRRSTGTLTPPPSPLPLPMVISRGNLKVRKVTLHGFRDGRQSPRPLQPFTRSSAPCTPTPEPPIQPQLGANLPRDLSGSSVWRTPRPNEMVDAESQRIKHESASLVTSVCGPVLPPPACPQLRFPRS